MAERLKFASNYFISIGVRLLLTGTALTFGLECLTRRPGGESIDRLLQENPLLLISPYLHQFAYTETTHNQNGEQGQSLQIFDANGDSHQVYAQPYQGSINNIFWVDEKRIGFDENFLVYFDIENEVSEHGGAQSAPPRQVTQITYINTQDSK